MLVRQVLGAIAQFEKASLVAKLKGARDRKRASGAKVEGRKSPLRVALARQLRRKRSKGGQRSLREISRELPGCGLSQRARPAVRGELDRLDAGAGAEAETDQRRGGVMMQPQIPAA